MTIRQAKEKLYIHHALEQKKLDMLIATRQRMDLKESCKKEASSLFNLLDLEDDDWVQMRNGKVKAMATVLYQKTVETVAAMKMKNNQKDKKEKEKREQAAKDLNDKTPAELFNKAIEEKVHKALKEAGVRTKTMPSPPPGLELAEAFVAKQSGEEVQAWEPDKPKNGSTPAKSGGNATKVKGKTGGKGKNQKGSGKGKGQQGLPMKGKGKSKNKETKGKGKSKGLKGQGGKKGGWSAGPSGKGKGKGW